MGDGLIIICHLCKAETQPRGVGGGGTGRRVGNRLQIVSLARFGCVLTCGGGGQGKARQGEKNMSAKAEGNKNNTKWK